MSLVEVVKLYMIQNDDFKITVLKILKDGQSDPEHQDEHQHKDEETQ